MKNKDATNNFGTIINEGYDFSVASLMVGRAGAQTVKGSKGIALHALQDYYQQIRQQKHC